jgi:hypothetical protein
MNQMSKGDIRSKDVHENGKCVKNKPLSRNDVHPNVEFTINSSLRGNEEVMSSSSNYDMPIILPMHVSESERKKLGEKHAKDREFRNIRAARWNRLTFEEKMAILGSANCEDRKKAILLGVFDPTVRGAK